MPRKSERWFKCYPEDYLEGTRTMSLEQRGAYWDCICLIYAYDDAIPDDPRWLSHQMHITLQKAKKMQKLLLDARKIVKTNRGLDNKRAIDERSKRQEMMDRNAKIAREREAKKKAETEAKLKKVGESLSKTSQKLSENFQKTSKFCENYFEKYQQKPNKNNETMERVVSLYARLFKNKDIRYIYIPPTPLRGNTADAVGGEKALIENKKSKAKKPKKIPRRLPDDWTIPDNWRDHIKKHVRENYSFEIDDRTIEFQADQFRDYWCSKSGKDATKLDWLATFRNRIKNAIQGGYLTPPDSYKSKSASETKWFQHPRISEMPKEYFGKVLEKYTPNGVWNDNLGPPPGAEKTVWNDELVKLYNLEKYMVNNGVEQ